MMLMQEASVSNGERMRPGNDVMRLQQEASEASV